jgi:hypothetical protein
VGIPALRTLGVALRAAIEVVLTVAAEVFAAEVEAVLPFGTLKAFAVEVVKSEFSNTRQATFCPLMTGILRKSDILYAFSPGVRRLRDKRSSKILGVADVERQKLGGPKLWERGGLVHARSTSSRSLHSGHADGSST